MRKTNQLKADLWMSRIMECRKSGLSDIRWCMENDIAPSSFYYWVKKLRMEASEIPVANHDIAVPFKQDVVPLHVVDNEFSSPDNKNATAIIIRLNSLTLEIQNGANESTIANTISVLKQLC